MSSSRSPFRRSGRALTSLTGATCVVLVGGGVALACGSQSDERPPVDTSSPSAPADSPSADPTTVGHHRHQERHHRDHRGDDTTTPAPSDPTADPTVDPTLPAPSDPAPPVVVPVDPAPPVDTPDPSSAPPPVTPPVVTPPVTPPVVTPSAPTSATPYWTPPVGTPWQWQLTGTLDLSVDAPVYDVDGFATSASQVSALHALGRHSICYIDVGTYEPWRPDAAAFPAAVQGSPVEGFTDEKWLDVRALSQLEPVLESRIAMCAAKGFDAVEPDNVDGYANPTGFAISAADQLTFNRWVASTVHSYGMSVALKNDLDQVGDLLPDFDFAVNEQCFEYGECDQVEPFVKAGKAVLHVEYDVQPATFCPTTTALGFSSMYKDIDLTAARTPCP